MTTYEHGRAPADAPVTWRRTNDAQYRVTLVDREGCNWCVLADCRGAESNANEICQWAHLAALVDEVAEGVNEAMIFAAGGEDAVRECKAKDWLRRYRAAKGER